MELILIPLLASLVVFALRGDSARIVALAATLATFAITIWRWTTFNTDGSYNYITDYAWMPSLGVHFKIGFDGISMLMVLLTNALMPIIVLSSFNYSYKNNGLFYGLLLLMHAALVGVFTALDGLLFYIFWELALIPVYFICALWGGEGKNRITLKFFIYTFCGSLLMLLSLIYLYLQTGLPGHRSFDWEALAAVNLTPETSAFVLFGFFAAFAIKMPVFPFHTWQPDTYTVAPTAGTMLLSGIMLKMGLYGVIRWMIPLAPEGFANYGGLFIILAIIGIVYASIIAIQQKDFKRLIAYSSIAHVGLIAAGVMAFNAVGLQGGLIQMLNHGINVIGLFFIADIIERRLGTRQLSEMGGIAKSAPKFAVLFMIVMLGSVAVPLTNGFVGEFLLLNALFKYHWIAALVAGLTIIFCAVYMLRAYQLAMFGKTNDKTAVFTDLNTMETFTLGIVSFLVILLGIFPQSVFDMTAKSVEKLLLYF